MSEITRRRALQGIGLGIAGAACGGSAEEAGSPGGDPATSAAAVTAYEYDPNGNLLAMTV